MELEMSPPTAAALTNKIDEESGPPKFRDNSMVLGDVSKLHKILIFAISVVYTYYVF